LVAQLRNLRQRSRTLLSTHEVRIWESSDHRLDVVETFGVFRGQLGGQSHTALHLPRDLENGHPGSPFTSSSIAHMYDIPGIDRKWGQPWT
jgi:hypothetical protein